ncbi:SCO family protein [Nocardioides sp. SYSU D00038]|uniref:SCO family protein n=1 Tax=Nocardioides sp. SYSU D00038 TaxID=2812554 RepID=UPI001967FC57|nr:SCO family protein [Nocardioides sp. SYSU D00038]
MPSRGRRAWARRAGAALLTGLLVTGLAACGGEDDPTRLVGQVVDPPFEVDPTALTDTDGEPFSLVDDTDARLTLVFFGYTRCPDICQTVMGTMATALQRLDDADREQVEVVFVTTDPPRDDAETVRRWLDRFDPSFVGLTGDLDDIEAVATSVAVGMGEKLPSGGYDSTTHTTQVTGVDTAGEAPIYWSQATSSAQLAADIHALLQES